MKVYLSPSQQEANIGVGDYGSESYRCQGIATRVGKLLTAAGVTVKQTPADWESLGGTEWLAKVVALSNDFDPDVHICIHTNAASDSSIHGTDAWYYPGSERGEDLTREVYKRVAEVSGCGRGVHTSPVFYETEHTTAPVCYIELGFHTNKADALSVIEHPDDYAKAIAEGICEHLGVNLVPPMELVPASLYPKLKSEFVQYMIRAQNEGNPIPTRDCQGFWVLAEKWGTPARILAWRISGRLDVKQTAKPSVELYNALRAL